MHADDMTSPLVRPDSIGRPIIASLAAAITCIATVGLGLSLSLPLLSFALDAKGASRTLIGLNTAVAGVATIVCAPFVAEFTRRVGLRAMLAAALAMAAGALMGFMVVEPIWAWFPLRFVFAGALTVLFVLSEYWIAAVAPVARRGLIMGIYATALSLGFAAGPQVLALVGTAGPAPYLVGAALMLLAAIPIILAGGLTPAIEDRPKSGIAGAVVIAPAATLAALVFGAAETAGFALMPLWGAAQGFSMADAALLISVVALGNLLFQAPLGYLSDRVDRRLVLLACALVGVAGMVFVAAIPMERTALLAVLFVWGGFIAGLYTVGLALLAGRFTGADLAQANAAFVMMYALGMMVGPPLAGAAMDAFPREGLPLSLAAMLAIYAAIVAGGILRSGKP